MFVYQYESNNCPCGPVGKNPLIPDDSPWFELLMRRMLIYFVTFFTYIRTSKDFHFYLFFLDGNYRVFFTSQNTRKIPYSLNAVNSIQAMARCGEPLFGVFFCRGIFPSKIGPIPPY